MASGENIARPYASAAFSVAKQENQLETWSLALKKMAIAIECKEMSALLKNPRVSKEILRQLLLVFAVEKSIQNFIFVLAEKKRLLLLPQISILFEAMLAKTSGLLALCVIAAFEMNPEQKKQTEEKLSKQFKSNVQIEYKVDPTLMGGLLVRSGDWVMDVTTLGQLNRLKTALHA